MGILEDTLGTFDTLTKAGLAISGIALIIGIIILILGFTTYKDDKDKSNGMKIGGGITGGVSLILLIIFIVLFIRLRIALASSY